MVETVLTASSTDRVISLRAAILMGLSVMR